MKYIIHSLDARNQKKPFYREATVSKIIVENGEDVFFTSNRNKATRFDDEDRARRWAIQILFLDRFEIEVAK